jgi:hypothetical protein
MKKILLTLSFIICGSIIHNVLAQQTNVNAQQNNLNINVVPHVIEKPVYIERYRTVYKDRPQPKRVARKLAAPVKLLGYLWVYPEDLGTFKQQPISVISEINAQNPYGRDSWRIPTPDELAVLENNAASVGLGDDIYLATDQTNGVLRLVSTGATVAEKKQAEDEKQKAIAPHGGVDFNGTVWAERNVGAANAEDPGTAFPPPAVDRACPNGWRLPTVQEIEQLGHVYKNIKDAVMFNPGGPETLIIPRAGYVKWTWQKGDRAKKKGFNTERVNTEYRSHSCRKK